MPICFTSTNWIFRERESAFSLEFSNPSTNSFHKLSLQPHPPPLFTASLSALSTTPSLPPPQLEISSAAKKRASAQFDVRHRLRPPPLVAYHASMIYVSDSLSVISAANNRAIIWSVSSFLAGLDPNFLKPDLPPPPPYPCSCRWCVWWFDGPSLIVIAAKMTWTTAWCMFQIWRFEAEVSVRLLHRCVVAASLRSLLVKLPWEARTSF